MLQIEIELEQTTILINLCDFISIKSQNFMIRTIKESYLYDTCISISTYFNNEIFTVFVWRRRRGGSFAISSAESPADMLC